MKIVDSGLQFAASDFANFVACRHLTRLELLRARGEINPPETFDLGFQALISRGETHEAVMLDQFRADGLEVIEIDVETETEAASATFDAMRARVDVIHQGALLKQGASGPALLGRPDFLVSALLIRPPDDEPRPDRFHYEVVDAKLARSAKARAVLQVAFYSQLLTGIQEVEPRWMHLALGAGDFASFKVKDYAAYERQTRRLMEAFVRDDPGENPPLDPYPEPVEHCSICRWRTTCIGRRHTDDDLSLVAGLTKRQRRVLRDAGIPSRRDFAAIAEPPDLSHVGRATLARAHLQAKLQVASEDTGRLQYELLDPDRDEEGALIPNRGLTALPEPTIGDLFFDIEGARFYSEDGREFGLEFLFGLVDTADLDSEGIPRYTQIWAFDRKGEKRAFEEVVDFITERRERTPQLHVFHYNHYEPTSIEHLSDLHETREEAVGRLMGRFATREDEVDDLFRLGIFVDLYRVVRQGLRAGVESYSIKRLEPLCGYRRHIDLRDVNPQLVEFEAALEEGTAADDHDRRRVVAGYNEDDCRAALALRDWLEERRTELTERMHEDLPRPVVEEDPHATEDPEVTRIRSALLSGVPDDIDLRSSEDQAKALVADLVDWHRREAKPAWWRFFHLRALTEEELISEPDAIGRLEGGDIVDHVKRSVIRRFSFGPQDHGFAPGDMAFDPATGKGWTVWSLDDERGLIELKIGRDHAGSLPRALIEGGPFDTRSLAGRLRGFADKIVRNGLTERSAATALLLRSRPDGGDDPAQGSLRRGGEAATDAAIRLALGLQDSYLPIQGPPGTGKTFTAAEQVCELVAIRRVVGITGPSHAVIHNLIDAVFAHADDRGETVRVAQRADEENPFLHPRAQRLSYNEIEKALQDGALDLVAGTIFMWARDQFQGAVDTLFVDEAGQLSLANVLTVSGAARNLLLLGDPQQLAQPSQAIHPPGAGVSALEHVLGARATIPPDAGLLIDRTWRMHPHLCRYTSQVFYDGKLSWVEGLEQQAVLGEGPLAGSGLRVVEVIHSGNSDASPEEAAEVAHLVTQFLGKEWMNQDGEHRTLAPSDVLVVTPYNAQVREIEDALARVGCVGVGVGTVDRFQGREAPIVVYSTASSSAEDAPRGMEFLYDLHRLNVAVSRARAMAVLVASPDLVRVSCQTPRQMFLANALCRAWEAGQE